MNAYKSLFSEMELKLQHQTLPVASFNYTRNPMSRVNVGSLTANKAKIQSVRIVSALAETAASVAVAATVVGAAATFLIRRTKSSQTTEADTPMKTCEDCEGSGICSECKGEGFVLKKLSKENAERARLMAKDAATRYTAGLPKKWSYCTKCSSGRSCTTCGGSGKLSYIN